MKMKNRVSRARFQIAAQCSLRTMAVDQAKIFFTFCFNIIVLMQEDHRGWSHVNDGPHRGTRTPTHLKKNMCHQALLRVTECRTMVEIAPIPFIYCYKMYRRHRGASSVVTVRFDFFTLKTIVATCRRVSVMATVFFAHEEHVVYSPLGRHWVKQGVLRYAFTYQKKYSAFATSSFLFRSCY